jgi:hypothetical protein
MTEIYTMYDSAYWNPEMLNADAIAGYIGGPYVLNTWSQEDWKAAESKPRLPIWVPNPNSGPVQAESDLGSILTVIYHYGMPKNQVIALDLETSQADKDYVEYVALGLRFYGYGCIGYGSLNTINNAVPPYLWKWSADWTNEAHLDEGMQATQWTSGQIYDQSQITQALMDCLLWLV